jgi:hypothetical protein
MSDETLRPIIRSPVQRIFSSVDEACEADRLYFEAHPDEWDYIRDFVPGEFGPRELPEIPPGFRYATVVHALRCDGRQIGRTRKLMAICDGVPAV